MGGTRQLIETLLRHHWLEVLEATPADPIGYGTDALNAALNGD